MKKLTTLLLIACGVITIAAWNIPSTAKPATSAILRPRNAATGIEEAKSTVTEIDKKMRKAFKNGDFAGITAYCATDAAIFPPNSNAGVKNENVISTWGRAIRAHGKDIRFVIDDISGNPGQLVESGKYEIYGDRDKLLARGKYTRLWKPENGSWKLFKDSSTSEPLPHKKWVLFRCLGL